MKLKMVHDDNKAVQRARKRSIRLVREMFADMATLVAQQNSLMSVMRYMVACFNYRVNTVVIGSHPYPDNVVPFLGASYAQQHGTPDTPTTRIIGQHFQDDPELRSLVVRCVRESWKTIKGGCIWLNASYYAVSNKKSTPVMNLKRLQYTVEFICTLLTTQATSYRDKVFTLLAVGKEALYVASSVKQRLLHHNITCTVIQSGQPAQLSRITYNRDLVGAHSNYVCIPPSAKKVLARIAKIYTSVQGTQESDIQYTMTKSVKALIESGMVEVLSKSNALGSEFDQIDSAMRAACTEKDTDPLIFKWFTLCRKQQNLISEMAEIIHTNAYVHASIHDNVIASLDASVKPSNAVHVNPVVNKTPDSKLPRATSGTDASLASVSAMTSLSIEDLLTPVKATELASSFASSRSKSKTKKTSVKRTSAKKTPVKKTTTTPEPRVSKPVVFTTPPKKKRTIVLSDIEQFKPGDDPFSSML